jgi:N-acetylglucosaminyldiphosphoundecaprenol N-acetyl-beta-D-mannosaminyltransferase
VAVDLLGHATGAHDGLRPASAIFEIPIDLADPTELLRTISGWASEGATRRVMYVNAHVVNQSRATPGLENALRRADLVYCDGYGIRLAARVLKRPVPHRMTGADWIWGLARLCELGKHPLYLLGSEPPRAQEAAARLRGMYPRLDVVGAHHGFFELDSPHNERVIEDIKAHRPRLVLVGMGTPKQELWVDRYADRLDGAVVWTVGALFDYVSGRTPRAPHWLADNGLEWIFRLAIEPQRMWRRYLLGNPVFLKRVLSEARHQRTPASTG